MFPPIVLVQDLSPVKILQNEQCNLDQSGQQTLKYLLRVSFGYKSDVGDKGDVDDKKC